MKISILTIILTIFSIFAGFSQQISKSMGTANSTFMLGNAPSARKSQLLFPPSVLTNVQPGKIRRIYFKYGSTGNNLPQTLTHFKIKFGLNGDNTFPGTSFYTDLITVFNSATYTIPAGTTGTWFSIPVDTIFDYDESKSLVIQLSFQTSTVANWGTFGSTNTPTRKIIAGDTGAVSSSASSTTWQDFGFDVTPGITSSAPQIFIGKGLEVFPNPASDKIIFKMKEQIFTKRNYLITNLKGQNLLSGETNESLESIDIRMLPAGNYFLEVSEEDQQFRTSFLKH